MNLGRKLNNKSFVNLSCDKIIYCILFAYFLHIFLQFFHLITVLSRSILGISWFHLVKIQVSRLVILINNYEISISLH